MAPVTPNDELVALRQRIDDIDHQILELLAARLSAVLEVGEYKRQHRIAVYDPERERRMLDRLTRDAPPPLDAETVRRVFERLIDESRRLEHRLVDG